MKQLKQMAFEQKKSIRLLMLYAALTGSTMVAQAYFFVKVVDGVFLKNASFEEVTPSIVYLLVVSFIRVLAMYGGRKAGISLAATVKRNMRMALVKKMTHNPIQASLSGQTGRKVNTVMDAVDEMDPYFSVYIPQMIQTTFIPLFIVIAVFTQHVYSGLILLITAPFIPLFMALVGMKTKQKSEEQLEKMATFSGHFLDVLQGLVTLKLFGRVRQQKNEIARSSFGFRDATMQVLKVAFLSALSLEFISMLSIGLVAFELGLQIVIFENVTFFSAFFILILVPDFYLSLKEFGSAFHAGRGSMGAAKSVIEELEKEEANVQWGENNVQSVPLTVKLRDVTFTYGEASFSLHKVNATIEPYEKVAIVGPNGAGKTTLLHVLAGLLQPSLGDVIINGKSRAHYEEKSWFDQISYISQHPYIFAGTIAENIAIGSRENATLKEIQAAAEQAGLSSMIESLQFGYETVIGEGGRGLSGGEKQRLALARAFLKKPTFILFDEPTTGLDLYTEQVLQTSINELGKRATVVTVAHRLHTIRNADTIYFLQDGEVVANGTHDELMKQVQSYKDMVTVHRGEAVK
ncbi:thiol reductant ABC exporter subunit CydD [Bacillus sp. CGMCC 1.16541]|uniref:thiol reductant ABC exporter subunit CydD n=1 Tax=Bacillus sp. CGMCC 1.16541 TaxID=2185143 RepID=UPI000D72A44F|nr:thiol reductant ABC exporter subunit CydD [Bacillus sp. CGMCC 1.16541]